MVKDKYSCLGRTSIKPHYNKVLATVQLICSSYNYLFKQVNLIIPYKDIQLNNNEINLIYFRKECNVKKIKHIIRKLKK